VSELAKPFNVTLVAIVQHIQVLETSRVVRTEKIGRVRTCQIDTRGLSIAQKWIHDRRSLWERRLDRLGSILAGTDKGSK
jgi:predicted transcriptional regulator